MKKLLIICFCVVALKASAQDDKARNYIERYKEVAIAEMQRSGVPAAITLAQGILESGCGEGDLCKLSNNHFGIKCKTEWTGEKVYHDDDQKQECFRSYPSAQESYKDHSDFLKTRENYAFLFGIDPNDYKSWAKGLKKAGYATEKNYPQTLIKVIETYNLNQFTQVALTRKELGTDSYAKAIPQKNTDNTNTGATIERDTVLGELVIPTKRLAGYYKAPTTTTTTSVAANAEKHEDSVVIINPDYNQTANKTSIPKADYPAGIFSINHAKVIYVSEGTSLLSIAKEHDIDLAKLLDINDMEDIDVTNEPQLIFLEKKQSRGSTDLHIVKAYESVHSVSQAEGIRLAKLLEYNKLNKTSTVKAGDKIYLRPATSADGLSK